MLDFLNSLKNEEYDALFFIPGDEEGKVHVEINKYQNPGEKIGGNTFGDEWHIILFKEDVDGSVTNLDNFDAILGCPLEYASTLIPYDWSGMIAKKTSTSKEFVEKVLDKLRSL